MARSTSRVSAEPQTDYVPVQGSYVLEFSLSSCAAGANAPVAGDLVIQIQSAADGVVKLFTPFAESGFDDTEEQSNIIDVVR